MNKKIILASILSLSAANLFASDEPAKVQPREGLTSIRIFGEDAKKLYNAMTKVKEQEGGEDGFLYLGKDGKDLSCGAHNENEGDENLEYSCTLLLKTDGSFSNATRMPAKIGEAKDAYLTVKTSRQGAKVTFISEGAMTIYDGMSKVKEVVTDDEIYIRKGKKLNCEVDASDGADATCRLLVNPDGSVEGR